MRRMNWARALALALAVTAAPLGAGLAQAQVTVGRSDAAAQAAEAQALALVEAAMDDFQNRGYAGLRGHLPKLKATLDNAPASYGLIEAVSDSEWVVRANHPGDALVLSVFAATAAQQSQPERAVTVTTRPNVYPLIALLLGSDAVERHAMEEAVAYLDQGLALQPGYAPLAAEKMAALQGMGRNSEALAVADAAMAAGGLIPLTEGRAMLLRRRGFSLIELGRLDEARAAFNQSLEVEPGNAAALGELQYIDSLEAGAKPVPGVVVPNGN